MAVKKQFRLSNDKLVTAEYVSKKCKISLGAARTRLRNSNNVKIVLATKGLHTKNMRNRPKKVTALKPLKNTAERSNYQRNTIDPMSRLALLCIGKDEESWMYEQ
jgi:hypothetical protein